MNFRALIISLITLTSANFAYASTLNGDAAVSLRSSLIKAGATAHVYTDASFVRVSEVICFQESGFLVAPLKCQFIEDGRSVEIKEVGIANALKNALNTAGLKNYSIHSGEYSKTSISANAIECATAAAPSIITCTITE